FKSFIKAQGGNPISIDKPELLPQAAHTLDVYATKSGVVTELIADKIGLVAMLLGAGRQTKDSKIDLAVGIILQKKLGDTVEKGDSLFTIHSNDVHVDSVKKLLLESVTISNEDIQSTLIHGIIQNG